MAYPWMVTLEFCHRRRVWRALGERRRIVGFDQDFDRMKDIFPQHVRISPKDTGSSKECVCTCC